MTDANVRRLTGVAGVLIGVGATLVVPLYFASAGMRVASALPSNSRR
jgi:hypothetical protein